VIRLSAVGGSASAADGADAEGDWVRLARKRAKAPVLADRLPRLAGALQAKKVMA
jgi:hypothetical protein